MFQSPIHGSQAMTWSIELETSERFQSPIHGSQAQISIIVLQVHRRFQSPIHGSQARINSIKEEIECCFNPLYTGHKLKLSIFLHNSWTSFNPLYTGHKRLHPSSARRRKNRVSIPYTRVTSSRSWGYRGGFTLFQSPIHGSQASHCLPPDAQP